MYAVFCLHICLHYRRGRQIVLTTGATMAQCAACLRSAGAETVVGLTLARAGQHLDSASHPE